MENYDVAGIGNPLMDIIVHVDEDTLLELDLAKGSMTLVDEAQIEKIEDGLKDKESKLVPGGSVANTLSGIALLGGSVVYMGMAGKDEHGRIYEEKLVGGNVRSRIVKSSGKTGKVISLVTPDSERTFATYLGVCLKLKKEDIVEEDIKDAKILHLTGYQLEDSGLRETSLHAIEIAKSHNTLISIDLADPELVKRTLEDMKELIKQADILFANEEEIKALTGKTPKESLKELPWINTLIVKVGKKGSMARHEGKEYSTQARSKKVVDTTGAGDMYAAGILYGLTHNLNMQKSMELASHVAAKIVETIGARLESIDKP